MKKIISLLTLISILAIGLFGCSISMKEYYAWKLERNEFIVCESGKSLEEINDELNQEIRFSAAEPFSVELTDYVEFVKMNESQYVCKIYEFETSVDAEKYAKHCVETRKKYDESKVAQGGRVVVVTDSETVMDILNIEFK